MSAAENRHPRPLEPEVRAAPLTADAKEAVLGALSGLRFGSVEVIVHEGRVVQIIRTEKVRIDR